METSIPLIIIALALLIIIITKTVTKMNVKKHIIELNFGKIFQFKTETEFNEEIYDCDNQVKNKIN